MTTAPEPANPSTDSTALKVVYWVAAIIGIGLTIWGVATYGAAKETERAAQKADELTAKYTAAGLTPPNRNIIIRTLGDDGGNICENPASALGVAILNDHLTNGGSHVGRRPVISDVTSFQGERLILETYCPDEVEDFKKAVEEFRTDNTVKND